MKNERNRIIIKTSIIGIIANVLLAAFKAAVGLAANSIAIILDAVNNLSDALSSLITIVGTKLAGKRPDKKHPFGYGRIEYISAMLVSAIILYAGITAAVESVKKIIHPEAADYSTLTFVIVGVAVVVKLILGTYVKKQGKKANSGALEASGADALFDAVLSLSVLASAVLFITTGISVEAWVGAVISVIIIKAGIEMMLETLNHILGNRADKDTILKVKGLIAEEPEVRGAYDVALHNYGPDRDYAAAHIEVPDTMTVEKLDEITRSIQKRVYRETGIMLQGLSVYSYNTNSDEAAAMRDRVNEIVTSNEWAIQTHGFYVDLENKEMRFDTVLSFDIHVDEALKTIRHQVHEVYPEYDVVISPDINMSEVE